MEYSYIRIDRSDKNLPLLSQRYEGLRLSALKDSPDSFASTFETESNFPDELWISRLLDPNKETFVAVAKTTNEWAAQVTLLGPVLADAYQLPEDSGQRPALPDSEEEKWQMLSLYTLPYHRGKSVGKDLCREAFRYLKSREGGPAKIRVRIMVKLQNKATVKMYTALGFADDGLTTLEEALRANGDGDLIPKGELSKKYTTRGGLIMSLSLDR